MYEIFEHTADLGIRVCAGSLDELFADAARGLFGVMVANVEGVKLVQEETFQLPGSNREELLHDWLSELLYTFYTRRLVLAEFHVQVGAAGISATARGEPLDPRRHEISGEVKAITWHGLKVEQLADGWRAEVIVDV
jgi:SHS2 domain-containing protein